MGRNNDTKCNWKEATIFLQTRVSQKKVAAVECIMYILITWYQAMDHWSYDYGENFTKTKL